MGADPEFLKTKNPVSLVSGSTDSLNPRSETGPTIRVRESSIRERNTQTFLSAHMSVSQRNPQACGWGGGGRLSGWRGFRLGGVAAFLNVSLSFSANVSALSHLHLHPFPVPQDPMGLSDRIVEVSLMSCPQKLHSCVASLTQLSVWSVPITHSRC